MIIQFLSVAAMICLYAWIRSLQADVQRLEGYVEEMLVFGEIQEGKGEVEAW